MALSYVRSAYHALKSGDWRWTLLTKKLTHRHVFRDGVVRLKGNGLMAIIQYVGPNLPKTENPDLAVLVGTIASQIGDFGRENAWTINSMCHVYPYKGYLQPELHIADSVPVPRTGGAPGYIDAVRAKRFEGELFVTDTYLALTYRPGKDMATKLEKVFYSSTANKSEIWRKHLRDFKEKVSQVAAALDDLLSHYRGWARICSADEVRSAMIFESEGRRAFYRFDDSQYATPVHKLWEKRLWWKKQVALDGVPFRHVRSVGVIDHPEYHYPEMMRELKGMGFPFKISQRARIFDRNVLKGNYRKALSTYSDASYSTFQHIARWWTPGGKKALEPDAFSDEERNLAENDVRGQAEAKCGTHITSTLVTWGDTAEEADERAKALLIALTNLGFYATIEHANSFFAYLGSFPGEIERNKRGDMFPEKYFAMRLPVTHPWLGDNKSNSPWGGPCLFQAVTHGAMPFRFDNYDNEGGGGAISFWGRNGTGKSTIARILAAHWLARHPNGAIIDYDIQSEKSTSRIAAWACGGTVVSVNKTRLQPLRHIDTPDGRSDAIAIIRSMLEVQGFAYTAEASETIAKALDLMASLPREQRTMSMFRVQAAASPDVMAAVSDYCQGGTYGHIMDGDEDPFELSPWTVIDLGILSGRDGDTKRQSLPVLSTVLYRTARLMDGERPTFMIIDEPRIAASALGHNQFIEWLAQNRKRRCVTVMCWHNSDNEMRLTGLEAALHTQCDAMLFACGMHVVEDGTREWMKRLGVTDDMAEEMKFHSHREWMFVKRRDSQIINFAIGKEELALFGVNSKEATHAAEGLYAQVGAEKFWIEWLKRSGFHDAEKVVRDWVGDDGFGNRNRWGESPDIHAVREYA